jgi:hypothetical protein
MKTKKGDLVQSFALAAAGVALAAVGIVGFSDEAGARQTLENAGYTPVEYQGHTILGCGGGDLFKDKFTVENPKGDVVEVTVCQGLFKDSTIRFGR